MQLCTTHHNIFPFSHIHEIEAVSEIKRVYEGGQFNIMFCCADCLRLVRRQSVQYGFVIEVADLKPERAL